ncbi:LysR family transcriptional regulator [Enterovibrio coralii]|uniref:HTH lysR-type domain-containing protein n=1 Tax=Enterovibrio coralii TaxID=294935 RepID=A0A135I3G7_9GAMM|nr:LysR family transcriptional regulator [Enterovibrio coralii]KXF79981.1 hypothetical protein ATN88_12150 [Enterovibrio coralii]
MDKLTAMHFFTRVAYLGSFSKVAKELHTSPSNVSKHIADLESRLGVRLLQRTTRVTTLTLAGEKYLKQCENILDLIGTAENEVLAQKERVSGLMRVSLPSLFANADTSRMLAEFMEKYPDLDIELHLNDRFVDLVDEGYDLSVRASFVQPDSSLIYRFVGKICIDLVGAKGYFEKHGYPKNAADLQHHDFIDHGNSAAGTVILSKAGVLERVNVHQRVRANNTHMVRDLVVQEQGIAFIPRLATLYHPDLERVLTDYDPGYLTLSVVYPERRHTPQKVYKFVEFLAAWFERERQTPWH